MILYTLAMLALGSLLATMFYEKKIKKMKENAQAGLDAMYHTGFESGMEKAQKDIDATIQSWQNAQVEEEARVAKLAEDIGVEISTQETSCEAGCSHEHANYSITFSNKKANKKKKPTKKKARKSKK